jgi:hypothetical protein
VFLLTSGECEVLVAASEDDATPDGLVRVGSRRKGDFVGEVSVTVSERQLKQVQEPESGEMLHQGVKALERILKTQPDSLEDAQTHLAAEPAPQPETTVTSGLHMRRPADEGGPAGLCLTAAPSSPRPDRPLEYPTSPLLPGSQARTISSLSPNTTRATAILQQAAGIDHQPTCDRMVAVRATTHVRCSVNNTQTCLTAH